MQDFATTLNQQYPDAHYEQQENVITGSWNLNAQASGPLGSDTMHFDYRAVVTLNPSDMTYTVLEHMDSANTDIGPDSNANIGPSALPPIDLVGENAQNDDGGINVFSSNKQTFVGHTKFEKQMGFDHAWGGNTVTYKFDADKIKAPLLQAVEAAGYHKKKNSLFGKLFG